MTINAFATILTFDQVFLLPKDYPKYFHWDKITQMLEHFFIRTVMKYTLKNKCCYIFTPEQRSLDQTTQGAYIPRQLALGVKIH